MAYANCFSRGAQAGVNENQGARFSLPHQGDTFAFVIAGDALRMRVQAQDAVHEESVAMMAMLEIKR